MQKDLLVNTTMHWNNACLIWSDIVMPGWARVAARKVERLVIFFVYNFYTRPATFLSYWLGDSTNTKYTMQM